MTTSILNDVKHILGILPDNTAFDSDILMLINTQFATLTQLGVGPDEGYMIAGAEEKWTDYLTDIRLNSVKSYIFLQVKIQFDPPKAGYIIQAYERQVQELTYRLNVVADYE